MQTDQAKFSLYGRDILVVSPTPTYPIDHGNRKKIYKYCQDLKLKGARIHFVYYPMEWPFSSIPKTWIDEMAKQWDSVHLVPVTRPLYQWASGEDHLIDEWWDRSLGDMLSFLFSRMCIDACIVNYPFMSKAFDFCSKNVFKILDMHDKFTDRRKILENNGIKKEFFYTTAVEEKKALERADLIWAIKEEEEEFFASISSKRVITLPYAEVLTPLKRVVEGAEAEYLVLGIIGAKNNINKVNIQNFIAMALPIFTSELAPIKIKLAGGMCDDMQDLGSLPGIELVGRINNVDSFYESVDVVLIPMAFSTGLKIKAIEAFAKQVPVIAHQHAVEGIPVAHDYHSCETNEKLIQACFNLSHNKKKLESLRAASAITTKSLATNYSNALNISCSKLNQAVKKIIVTVNQDFFNQKSIYREHVMQHILYLSGIGKIIIYCENLPVLFSQNFFELLNFLGSEAKLASPKSNNNQEYGLLFWETNFTNLVENYNPDIVWFESILDLQLKTKIDCQKYVRIDSLALNEILLENLSSLKQKLLDDEFEVVSCQGISISPKYNTVPFFLKKPKIFSNARVVKSSITVVCEYSQVNFAIILLDFINRFCNVNTSLYIINYKLLDFEKIKQFNIDSLLDVNNLYQDLILKNEIPGYFITLSDDLQSQIYTELFERLEAFPLVYSNYSSRGLNTFLSEILHIINSGEKPSQSDLKIKYGNVAGFNKIYEKLSSLALLD